MKHHRFWAWGAVICMVMTFITGTGTAECEVNTIMMNFHKGAALFVGGVLFGSAGFKLLSSKDAKKAYTHMTAAALRVQESVMETVTSVQENAADILASAKEINEQRAKAEEATSVECSEA